MKAKILYLIFFLFFFSCKKEKEISSSMDRNIFVNSDWVITSNINKTNTLNPNAMESDVVEFYDDYSTTDECWKDDINQFRSDQTYHLLPGLNNCGGVDSTGYKWLITETGNLKFISTGTTNNLIIGTKWEFQNVSEESFEMYLKEENFNTGEKSVRIIEMTAQ